MEYLEGMLQKEKDNFSVMICTTTCYTYIEKGIFFKYNKQKSSN